MASGDTPLQAVLGLIGRRGRLGGAFTGVLAVGLTAVVFARGLDDYHPADVPRILALLLYLLTFALLFGANVWKQDDRFKPMKLPELVAALNDYPRPYVVCLDCKLLVPFEASVGTCPRCEQRSSCMEVNRVEDITAVRNALG